MKTPTKTLLALLLAAGASLAIAAPSFADSYGQGGQGWRKGDHQGMRGHGPDRKHGFQRGQGPGGERFAMRGMFEQFDADGDGRITQDEIDAVRGDRLARFDADKDGALSLEEYQALWLDAMRERMVRAFQAHDRDGDGKVTAEEFNARFDRMVERLDRNDDGAIDRSDMRRSGPRDGRGPQRQQAPQPLPAPQGGAQPNNG
ncbi:EF-hand domain-containing protein [Faunimonas sp. B44]|uniref:EF-hand domain-containing protein n=1 Tax=Faunimonas sp. B44 TaxID=3461493 RepID=UPI004043F31A